MFKNQNLEKNKNMFWNILGPNLTGQSPLNLFLKKIYFEVIIFLGLWIS